jgi:hypothetical protein
MAVWFLLTSFLLFSTFATAQPAAKDSSGKSAAPSEAVQPGIMEKNVQLTYEDRKTWRAVLKWSDDCEQAFDYPDKSYGGLEFYRLAEKRYLVEVVCTGGAYQGYQVYFFYDEAKRPPTAKALTFESFESQDEKSLTKIQTSELWGLPTFDENTKELTVLNKFRGMGDCGILASYEFRDGQPKLKELRAKLVCDGEGADAPEKWERIGLQ